MHEKKKVHSWTHWQTKAPRNWTQQHRYRCYIDRVSQREEEREACFVTSQTEKASLCFASRLRQPWSVACNRHRRAILFLVAFHPRPQIASDLGRNVTRSFNLHNEIAANSRVGTRSLAYGRRFKSQPALNPPRFENRKPNPPLFWQVIWTPQIANPQAAIAELGPPGGRKSQNRRPHGH